MPDLDRIGGVSGWMAAAALADAHRIELSSHLFPEVSAHLLAASPTAHWLEYVDWADAILEEPLKLRDGALTASTTPGSGISWNDEAVRRYAVSD
jgi:mandelate racemase